MESVGCLIVVVILVVLVAVPVLIAQAFSRANKALERCEFLERQMRENASELRIMRERIRSGERQPAPDDATTVKTQTEVEAEPAVSTSPAEPAQLEPEDAATPDSAPQQPEATDSAPQPTGSLSDAIHRIRKTRESQQAKATTAQGEDQGEDEQAHEPEEQLVSAPASAPAAQTPPRNRMSFEELLAGKVFVWIGAVALVLTGAFLLKYGYENYSISETGRVITAAIFGIALLGVGEWLRKKYVGISQALCGAGIADLFGTVLAASSLYHLIGPTTGYILMAVITAGAVVLSLRHGPLVALLGIVGGFTLPPLIGQPLDAQPAMIVYLIALEVGVLAVSRKRGWVGISTLTLIFSMAWSLGYTLIGESQADRLLTGLLVMSTAVIFVLNTAWTHHRDEPAPSRLRPLWLSIGALAAGAAMLGLLVNQGGYALGDLGMLGLMAAGTLVLARLDGRYRSLTWVAAGLCFVVLLAWSIRVHDGTESATLAVLCGVIAGFGGLFALGGYIAAWSGDTAGRRGFAWLSAASGPAFLALATFAGSEALGWRDAWWYWTAGLAGLYALATGSMLIRRRTGDHWLAELFAAVAALLSFIAIGQAMSHPWPVVGWSVFAACLAMVGYRLKLTTLLHGSAVALLGSAVGLLAPGPFSVEARGIIVFNTYLLMYVMPTLCFAIVGWSAKQAKFDELVQIAWPATVATAAVGLVVLTRHGFAPVEFNSAHIGLYERGTYGLILLAYALSLHSAARFCGNLLLHQTSRAVGLAALIVTGAGCVVPGSPMFDPAIDAGKPLAFALGYLYLLPAVGFAVLAYLTDRSARTDIGRGLRIGAVTLVTIFVGMQVRNGFHFENLREPDITVYEWATYGLTWSVLGALLGFVAQYLPSKKLMQYCGLAIGLLGIGVGLLGTVLVDNPLWRETYLGKTPLLTGLWYVYLPSILALAGLAKIMRSQQRAVAAQLAGFTAVAMVFLFVSLMVRQAFSGDGILLIDGRPDSSEWYAYSLAWVLLGIALLVGGVITGLNTLRFGSLAVMLIAVGKVFALDTAQLADLYRVFSFLGLGVTLILLGYVYQRFVLGKPGLISSRTASRTEGTS